MSKISKHRARLNEKTGAKLFDFQVDDERGQVMFSLCLADDGLYYYEADAKLLTEDEDASTSSSYISYVTMEDMKALFEALQQAHLDQIDWKITAQRGRVVIEQQKDS